MAEIRLSKLIKQFNIGLDTLVDFLNSKGAGIEDANPNLKVSDEYLAELHKKFGKDLELKEAAEKVDVKLTEILDKASKKQDSDEDDEFEPERVSVIKSNNLSRAKAAEPQPEPEPVVEEPEPVAEPEPVVEEPEPVAEPEPVVEEPEPEPVTEPEPELEPISEPAPESTPEVRHEPVVTRARERQSFPTFWKVLLIVLGALIVLLAIYALVGRLAPGWVDKLLYSPEELEILRY